MLGIKPGVVPLLYIILTFFPAHNSALQEEAIENIRGFERLTLPPAVVGPESFAFDRSGGGPYTGVSDGRILKWQGRGLGWSNFAVTSGKRVEGCDGSHSSLLEKVCGRPLGLQFNKVTGDLYIADAYYGLVGVGPEGGVATQLATGADGEPFHFLNGLDVDQESGMVYFADSSTKFQRWDYILVVLTGDATGRLLSYDPGSQKVTVLIKDLVYPNSVVVSKDNTFLLVTQTTLCRILRYWIRGPKAGTTDIFAELPGYPDNITKNAKGEYWVALSQQKPQLSTSLKGKLGWSTEHPVALRLSEEGSILEVLDGKILTSISEVEENNGTVWVGSVIMPYAGVYKL